MMLKMKVVWIGIAMVAISSGLQAQEAGSENVAAEVSPSALYHQDADRLNREHWKILMEIDATNRAAHKAFSEENVRRSVALGQANRDAHTDLAASDLSVSERGEKATQIQAENDERREAHAAWRDATYQEILGNHEAKRKAQFDAYHASLDALRAELQRKLDLVGVTSGELVAPVLIPDDDPVSLPMEPGIQPVRPAETPSDADTGGPDAPVGARFVRIEPGFTMTGVAVAIVREWGPQNIRISTTFRVTGLGDAAVREFEPVVYRLPETFTMTGTSQ